MGVIVVVFKNNIIYLLAKKMFPLENNPSLQYKAI
jgi:hypothetical protein